MRRVYGREYEEESFPAKRSENIASIPLARVMTDLCGPITPTSTTRKRYAQLYADQKTTYVWPYYLSLKSEVEDFKTFPCSCRIDD